MVDPGSVDPTLGPVSLRIAAYEGDRALFDAYLAEYEASTVPQEKENYLLALGRFRDPTLQRAVLDLSLSDKVAPSDVFSPIFGLAETEAGSRIVMQWIESEYPAIAARLADEYLALLPYVAYGCNEEVLQRAKAFFSQTAHQVEGTSDSLDKAIDATTDCLSLRRREGDSVADYLAQSSTE